MNKYGRAVIAISEGIEDERGFPLAWDGKTLDSHNNPQFAGSTLLAEKLTNLIEKSGITKRIRADTLGYMQRSYLETISEQDWKEATAVGVEAVRLAIDGNSEGSVAILRNPEREYNYRLELTSLESVARTPKHMPLEFINKNGNDIMPAFVDYVRPLIGCSLLEHGRLQMNRVF